MKFTTAIFIAACTEAASVGNGKTTNSIQFNNLPGPYSYTRATAITPDGPSMCTLGKVSTDDGPLAPLTGEMHHILRGPIDLKQFAVYYPKAAPAKREAIRESAVQRRGRINHLDKHKNKRHAHEEKKLEKRVYGDWVTATINNNVVSFIDNWSPHEATAAAQNQAPAEQTAAPVAALQVDAAAGANPVASPVPAAAAPASNVQASSSPQAISSSSNSDSDWSRIAYFDAATSHAENIAFTSALKMTNQMFLGFMPGYVASDATTPADSAQIISGYIPDNHEIIVTSASTCDSDTSGACGVVTPGLQAYHGFKGDRIVMMEYTMPHSNCGNCANAITGNSANTNRPAIWALNSEVVNIAQYGFNDKVRGDHGVCSGWGSGAGEFDIHEILPGDEPIDIGYSSFQMIGHYRGTNPEGIVRPTDPNKTQKLAYILSGKYAGIHVLDDNFNMDDGLSAADVQALISGAATGPGVQNKLAKNTGVSYPADQQSSSFSPALY